MSDKKPMSLLLIEDDIAECAKFKNCANNRTDVTFVGMTGSSAEGVQYVTSHLPEGVILDLELHKGQGSGIKFLEDLKSKKLNRRPIVVVTTNTSSPIVHNHTRDNGVDYIFYKGQSDYSPEMVINILLSLREFSHTAQNNNLPNDLQTIESPEELHNRIATRISAELNFIGINMRYKGRAHLEKAIFHLITNESDNSHSVISQVAISLKVPYNTIIRAIQTSINKAWKNSCIDDLKKHYTMRINIHTGVPSPSEFIHYYADKIRKTM
ncbi:MAG: response regulator [Oscillospiraceae bacterium]|nr:response regulator [Oscillospiraceae bacterium]